jgi:PAS domain S-box-containing protein
MQRYQAEAQRLSRTGSFSWDVRTGEITWSDEVYRIYGYEPTVKPTMELARRRLHPDDVALFNETARRALHDGNEIQFGHRLLMPDGSVKWLQIVSTAVRDGSGKVVEYIGAVRDVTEQRRSDTR